MFRKGSLRQRNTASAQNQRHTSTCAHELVADGVRSVGHQPKCYEIRRQSYAPIKTVGLYTNVNRSSNYHRWHFGAANKFCADISSHVIWPELVVVMIQQGYTYIRRVWGGNVISLGEKTECCMECRCRYRAGCDIFSRVLDVSQIFWVGYHAPTGASTVAGRKPIEPQQMQVYQPPMNIECVLGRQHSRCTGTG